MTLISIETNCKLKSIEITIEITMPAISVPPTVAVVPVAQEVDKALVARLRPGHEILQNINWTYEICHDMPYTLLDKGKQQTITGRMF